MTRRHGPDKIPHGDHAPGDHAPDWALPVLAALLLAALCLLAALAWPSPAGWP